MFHSTQTLFLCFVGAISRKKGKKEKEKKIDCCLFLQTMTGMSDRFYEMIFKRKSFHVFKDVGDERISDEEVKEIALAYKQFSALDPTIKTAIRIVPGEETTCKRGEQFCILFYSEKKDNYLQNIGYLGEQMDLYLVSRNIGTLWFGIGKTTEAAFDGLDFVIMIAIHKVGDAEKFRKDMFKSKRKTVDEIWEGDVIEGVADIIRFAPSACNTQPWLVKNAGDISVYRFKKPGKRGIMPAEKVSFYNQIDIGIFLYFMEMCLTHCGREFERELHSDHGDDVELTLNAVYKLTSKEEYSEPDKKKQKR